MGQGDSPAHTKLGSRRTRSNRTRRPPFSPAMSASMGSGGADCLEDQAHWPCGHARGLNGKTLPLRTKQDPLSQPRSASGKLASRIGSKEERRVAALRERRLRAARESSQQSKRPLPQATSASMGSGEADCLEAQAHWPCGHARGPNGKMPARTQRSVNG